MTFFGQCLLTFLGMMNLIAFSLCGIDKWKAQHGLWRVPERILFGVAFLGGGVGFWIGMKLFRHKTRHLSFRILIPLAIVLWIILLVVLQLKWSLILA